MIPFNSNVSISKSKEKNGQKKDSNSQPRVLQVQKFSVEFAFGIALKKKLFATLKNSQLGHDQLKTE